MRVFAISDIHADYDENARWVANLSDAEYREDVLIVAGDISDVRRVLQTCLAELVSRFRKVLFVPGNHELWVVREDPGKDSLQKFREVISLAEECGASTQAFCERGVSILPLFGWYDYSFGEPSEDLRVTWLDYRACCWPNGLQDCDVAAHFLALNNRYVKPINCKVITYSHFLPRIDIMPEFVPAAYRRLYPILGTARLDRQIRILNSSIHVYGHTHLNWRTTIDGVSYIGNAFGYPSETRISSKRLVCIHEC